MDIAVKTEDLKKVVSCASRATSNKAIQPILNNILLSSATGSLIISATDLDLAIECKLPADVKNPGSITLPAKKFDEIVSKVTGIDIKIRMDDGDESKLTKIQSDRSKFQINGVSSEGFPVVINKDEIENIFSVDQEAFLNAISLTSFSASRFESTSILSGVKLEIKNNQFELGAADGSRLARYIGKLSKTPKSKDFKQGVVIPVRALDELEKLIKNFKEGNDEISFHLSNNQVIFQNKDFTLSTRLVGGVFPEYENLIPPKQPSKAIFSRMSLLSALERVAILANERTNVIRLSFSKGLNVAKLSANSPDYGNAVDEVDVEYKGTDLEIAFNHRYLSEILRNLKEEKIELELDTSLSPLILNLERESYSYTYLIMPVQLR